MSSSVGVFREVEIDEESVLVYTLTHPDNPNFAGEVVDINPVFSLFKRFLFFWRRPPPPSFFCPTARIKFQELKLEEEDDNDDVYPVTSSPHFPSTRSGDQQGESLLDFNHPGICKLPLVHLKRVDDKFECGACVSSRVTTSYYGCLKCRKQFHKECVECPLEIRHPSHPFHPLRLHIQKRYVGYCICCGSYDKWMYHCKTCNLFMRSVCAMSSIPCVEYHPKSHPHPLTFFPTQASLVCHVCGQIKNLDPTYICTQCVFVIHKNCLGFPHVIRISRHHHRISFTPSLPPGKLSCGVCRQPVDNNYGAYSCSKGEDYYVHSRCALDRRVWDGEDLDGVPEENDIIDDGEPFKRIDVGIILHPSHSHNLQLETVGEYDESKYCRGCALPIYQGNFYSCMKSSCDFILHESCASAPRMIRHPLHPHPLTLQVALINGDVFRCDGCHRDGTVFYYNYRKDKEIFRLDLRCASITEPFEYEGHPHPLFLPLEPKGESRCQICKYESYEKKIICMECDDYRICFRCATFPYKAMYKHNSTFLTVCRGKGASDQLDWCEVCEGKIEEVEKTGYYRENKIERLFYKCEDGSTTLHAECLFGRDMYMKPGNTITDSVCLSQFSFASHSHEALDFRILHNSSLSRPICIKCKCRCRFPVFFKGYAPRQLREHHDQIFCSWNCIPRTI